jgi:hypothetical protein
VGFERRDEHAAASRPSSAAAQRDAKAMRQAAADLIVVAHRPDPKTDTTTQSKYLEAHGGISPMKVYPEFPWRRVSEANHPETLWRAEFDRSSSSHVQWWINVHGQWGNTETDTTGGINLLDLAADLWNDFASVLSKVVDAVRAVANVASDVLDLVPWQDIADAIEAATSTIPVLGTAVSDWVATGEVFLRMLSGEGALEQALRDLYTYTMASTPGAASLRPILDPVVDAIVRIAVGEPPTIAVIKAILDDVPDAPNINGTSPRSVAASLVALVVHDRRVTA